MISTTLPSLLKHSNELENPSHHSDALQNNLRTRSDFLSKNRPQPRSTNPLERFNGEIKQRIDVVTISADEGGIVWFAGATLLAHNDEWAANRIH
jgi:putative transposase